MRIRASSAVHRKKDALSTASAQPGFSATTRMPPSAGPTTRTPLRDRPCSALACCRRAGLTVCGTSPASAGTTSPSPSPHRTPSTASSGTVATPASTMAAVAACAAPCTSEAPTSTRLRRARSDSTPPKRSTAALAPWRTAITIPSDVAPATSSTANASATVPTAPPTDVVSVAPNRSRYSRSRNAPSPSPSRLPTTGTRCTIVARAASRAGAASSPRLP
jgi:hypothetical protein